MTNKKKSNQFGIEGFKEAVLSVRNLKHWTDFYQDVAGWEVIYRGEVDANILHMWNLPDECSANEVLVANPGDDNGFLRLVQFNHVDQVQIRSSAQLWESGGIAGISTRCINMTDSFNKMQQRGWQGFSDPVEWQFGPFSVSEWVARGEDGVVQSITQRLAPPLEGWPTMKRISRVFNSPQIVSNMPVSLNFYKEVLDFTVVLNHVEVSKVAENVFGMPYETYTSTEHEINMLHPEGGDKTGSVELIAFDGLSGRDFSSRAVPPNLGVLMLRFPIQHINRFIEHLNTLGIEHVVSTNNCAVVPYGSAMLVALKTPDGAWLEFYELK